MRNQAKNNSGLLVCGACAVPANSSSPAVTSIDVMVDAFKRFFKTVA